MILRAPDSDVWRPQWERLIEDGAEVMESAEAMMSERDIVVSIDNLVDACARQVRDEVPGE